MWNKPNENESNSVNARQILDLKIGVSFSWYQTQEIIRLYPEIKRMFHTGSVTYGPCQIPTLGFCVDWAEKIAKFVPEKYWTIKPEIKLQSKTYTLKWNRKKLFNE